MLVINANSLNTFSSRVVLSVFAMSTWYESILLVSVIVAHANGASQTVGSEENMMMPFENDLNNFKNSGEKRQKQRAGVLFSVNNKICIYDA